MGFGFGNQDEIPKRSTAKDTQKKRVKQAKSKAKPSISDIVETNVTFAREGLVNNRSFADDVPIRTSRVGRPKKIRDRSVITIAGEREIIDQFKDFCDKRPESYAECLLMLLKTFKSSP